MKIRYSHTYWGSDHLQPEAFVKAISSEGYQGMELFLQPGDQLSREFMRALEEHRKLNPDFYLILLQITFPGTDPLDVYLQKMQKNIEQLAALQPDFINSHTGSDYFHFDDNCRAIEVASSAAEKAGVPLYHETHRGRFSFHAPTLIPYLEKFPDMELVADLSHFCTASESMLEGQEKILEKIFPHVAHVHARIGSEQGPQVNDPTAPEWNGHVQKFLKWWKQIVEFQKARGRKQLSFTTEFGPPPYQICHPNSEIPLSNQWQSNVWMLSRLRETLGDQA